jgi:hypothetical protein
MIKPGDQIWLDGVRMIVRGVKSDNYYRRELGKRETEYTVTAVAWRETMQKAPGDAAYYEIMELDDEDDRVPK